MSHLASSTDVFIEAVDGIMGGRPVIKGTRITVSAIQGRLATGDTIQDLVEDYPDVPPEAFAAARCYGEPHIAAVRPASAAE